MRNNYFTIVFISIQVLLFTATSYSQDHGKIISSEEADKEFDSVLVSVTMPVETMQDLISKTENNIMFKLIEDSVVVLDNNRNVIFPEGKSISDEDIFTLFSTSLLNELIVQGKAAIIFIEQRNHVLTITSGNYTLEFGPFCPPICN